MTKEIKVYVLLRHIDHEGSDVLAVYLDKAVADAWKRWCDENGPVIRESIGEPDGRYAREWEPLFQRFPGDSYSVEEHTVRSGDRLPKGTS